MLTWLVQLFCNHEYLRSWDRKGGRHLKCWKCNKRTPGFGR
jgi:hypothetical protein